MKAWTLTTQAPIEEKPLTFTEIADPHADDYEIRIRVSYSGICRTDIHIAEGDLPLKKSPIILGHEVFGIVDEMGEKVTRFRLGERVGAYWLHSTCGHCKYCHSDRENYCPDFQATGWHANGGFAEYMAIPEGTTLSLESVHLDPSKIPPLLCPGIAGYAAFKLADIQSGENLGLYGFGPTAYYVLKIAQSLNIETYVSTRSPKNVDRAVREGAVWAADSSNEDMPVGLDAAILFPPAGNLVEPILSQVKPRLTIYSRLPSILVIFPSLTWTRTPQPPGQYVQIALLTSTLLMVLASLLWENCHYRHYTTLLHTCPADT